jgi:hypothetical protein
VYSRKKEFRSGHSSDRNTNTPSLRALYKLTVNMMCNMELHFALFATLYIHLNLDASLSKAHVSIFSFPWFIEWHFVQYRNRKIYYLQLCVTLIGWCDT